MTYYAPKPISVEARRFEGGSNAMPILSWLAHHRVKTATFFCDSQGPDQLDLGIPHIKIAEAGDYIVRRVEDYKDVGIFGRPFMVLTEEQFKATYDPTCMTCSGPIRETVNMVCQSCGHDYSKGS